MKQLLLTTLILLLCLNANALIVSVDGYGDIEETPMQITITEAHQDPLSGKTVVEMKGQLLCQGALEVTIQRSAAGMTDEFCCGQCLTGNGQMTEVLNFTPGGMSSWYSHYYPAANDNQQVVYTFREGEEVRQLIVRYQLSTEDIDAIEGKQQQVRKCLKDGLIYIIKDDKIYHL